MRLMILLRIGLFFEFYVTVMGCTARPVTCVPEFTKGSRLSLADVNVVEQCICADPCLRSWTVIGEYLYVQMLFRIGGRGRIRERISQHLRTCHMSELIGYTVEESVIKLIPRHHQRDLGADCDVSEPDHMAIVTVVEVTTQYRELTLWI